MSCECGHQTINAGDLRLTDNTAHPRPKRVLILPPSGAALVDQRFYDEIVFLSDEPPIVDLGMEENEALALKETTYDECCR